MSKTYDLPLLHWIAASLQRTKLQEVAQAIRAGKKLPAYLEEEPPQAAYLEKILREEITKQFSFHLRPYLEPVLNALDAITQAWGEESDEQQGVSSNALTLLPLTASTPYPPSPSHLVDIRVKPWSYTVEDNGKGMTLEEVLQFLIIPFNTEKEGIETIGMFGVGFFSTLKYCLQRPWDAHIEVETMAAPLATSPAAYPAAITPDSDTLPTAGKREDGQREGLHLRFYARGMEIKDLHLRIQYHAYASRRKKPSGTLVKINRWENRSIVKNYIAESVSAVPPYVGRINLNGTPVNDVRKLIWTSEEIEGITEIEEAARTEEAKKEKWQILPVEMHLKGKTRMQPVGVLLVPKAQKQKEEEKSLPRTIKDYHYQLESYQTLVSFSSQGILVKRITAQYYYGAISFPSGVQVVEGRDQFKIDENYHRALQAAYQGVIDSLRTREQSIQERSRSTTFFWSLTNNLVSPYPEIIERFKGELLPGKEYVVSNSSYPVLESFLGNFVEEKTFATSITAERFWKTYFKGAEQLLQDLFGASPLLPASELPEFIMSKAPNLEPFLHFDAFPHIRNFRPVQGIFTTNENTLDENSTEEKIAGNTAERKEYAGPRCFLYEGDVLYLNMRHPTITQPFHAQQVYNLLSEYFTLPEERSRHSLISQQEVQEFLLQKCNAALWKKRERDWQREEGRQKERGRM